MLQDAGMRTRRKSWMEAWRGEGEELCENAVMNAMKAPLWDFWWCLFFSPLNIPPRLAVLLSWTWNLVWALGLNRLILGKSKRYSHPRSCTYPSWFLENPSAIHTPRSRRRVILGLSPKPNRIHFCQTPSILGPAPVVLS